MNNSAKLFLLVLLAVTVYAIAATRPNERDLQQQVNELRGQIAALRTNLVSAVPSNLTNVTLWGQTTIPMQTNVIYPLRVFGQILIRPGPHEMRVLTGGTVFYGGSVWSETGFSQ